MADGKEKAKRFHGALEGVKYQGEARSVYRDGRGLIETRIWCDGKKSPGNEQMTELAFISVVNESAQNICDRLDIMDSPQKKLLFLVLEILASKNILIDNEKPQIMVSVCPTMAKGMDLPPPGAPHDIYVESEFLKHFYEHVRVRHYEQGRGNMSNNGTAKARSGDAFKTKSIVKKRRETDQEKEIRGKKRQLRCERELNHLHSLTAEQRKLIGEALQIISSTQSTWLVNIFKLAASTRSRELSIDYGEAEMSFEPRNRSWSEIWNEPDLRIKIYESFTDALSEVPEFFHYSLLNLGKRITKLRGVKVKRFRLVKAA